MLERSSKSLGFLGVLCCDVAPSLFSNWLEVVAIIALLAAILFAVFGRARENARRSSCQSNLKQIGLAMFQYVQDYDGYQPGTEVNNVAWPVLLIPYTKSGQIFYCPSSNRGQSFTVDPKFVNGNPNGAPGDFGVTATNEATIQDAAGTIHIVDGTAYANNGDSITGIRTEIGTHRYLDATNTKLAYRHLEGFNAMFGDGHVKWCRWGSTTANEWTIQADNPNGTLQ